MKLLAVRDLNTQDPLPALGPKVEPPAPAPPPALRPTATPGIMQRPDGKLETDLPLPPPAHFVEVRVHDSVIGPIFSETNKNDWWAFAAADNAKRLERAHHLSTTPENFRRMWETDFADAELRNAAAQVAQVAVDRDAVFNIEGTRTGRLPKRTASRRTYDECEEQFVKNFEAGRGIPLMAPETAYPIEALQDRIVRSCLRDAKRLYQDPTTGLVIIPLPGVPGADYFS